MENTLCVAKMFNDLYKADFGVDMDEMRMYKMMYFAQRESLMRTQEKLFNSDFYGWKFGPVLLDIRSEYVTGSMLSKVTGTLSEAAKDLVRFVYDRYNDLSFWKLSALSHGEVSWKYARKGLDAKDNGNVTMRVADMKLDAAREYYRRKRG